MWRSPSQVITAITLPAATLVLGETIGWALIASCGLVIRGTYLANRYTRRTESGQQ